VFITQNYIRIVSAIFRSTLLMLFVVIIISLLPPPMRTCGEVCLCAGRIVFNVIYVEYVM